MKIICITGSRQPDLAHVNEILGAAGVDPASLSVSEQPAEALAKAQEDSGFVLVWSTPARVLAGMLTRDGAGADIDGILDTWQRDTAAMLRFYNRNQHRALLVDAEGAVDNPAALVAACAASLGLPALHWTGAAQPAAAENSLLNYLATEKCKSRPEVLALQKEVEASCALNAGALRSARLLPPNAAIRRALELQDELDHSQQAAARAHRLHQENHELSRKASTLSAKLEEIQAECARFSNQLTGANAHAEQFQSGASTALLHLYEAQQRLEQAAAGHDEAASHLLLALHDSQEDVEQLYLGMAELQDKTRQQAGVLRKLFAAQPDYVDCEELSCLDVTVAGKVLRLRWRLRGFSYCRGLLAALEVETEVAEGRIVAIRSLGGGQAGARLDFWTASAQVDPQIYSAGGAWQILRTHAQQDLALALANLLAAELADERQARQPEPLLKARGVDTRALLALVQALKAELQRLPEIVHYGRVRLIGQQQNADYEHLWFRLDDVRLGDVAIGTIEFRLASAALTSAPFGTNPKIELPITNGFLQNWYPESADELGPKLELRFAMPDAMDLEIWHKLSPRDHWLLACLISRLPEIVAAPAVAMHRLQRPWDDWAMAAANIHAIVAARFVNLGLSLP